MRHMGEILLGLVVQLQAKKDVACDCASQKDVLNVLRVLDAMVFTRSLAATMYSI